MAAIILRLRLRGTRQFESGRLLVFNTFVIVDGAWADAWEWSGVARLLYEHGHEVFTPTLTALGERAHLG